MGFFYSTKPHPLPEFLNFLVNDIPQPFIPSRYPSTSMVLDLNQAEKTVRKVRKLLKKMSNPPTPEEVHAFRTNSRRVDPT
jgi:hypothetical protein